MYSYIVALCSDIHTKKNVKFLEVKWLIVFSVDDVCFCKVLLLKQFNNFNSPINRLGTRSHKHARAVKIYPK